MIPVPNQRAVGAICNTCQRQHARFSKQGQPLAPHRWLILLPSEYVEIIAKLVEYSSLTATQEIVNETLALRPANLVARVALHLGEQRLGFLKKVDEDGIEIAAKHSFDAMRLLKVALDVDAVQVRHFTVPVLGDTNKLSLISNRGHVSIELRNVLRPVKESHQACMKLVWRVALAMTVFLPATIEYLKL